VLRFLEPTHGPVLDLACGSGRWTQPIVSRFGAARVIGLDLSWAMLRAIRTNLAGPLYVRGSALCLPFGDGKLGGVNCSNALQLMPAPDAVIKEVGRCLASGGSFTGFTYRKSSNPVYRYFQDQHCRAFSVNAFTEDEIRRWLDAAGMEVVDISGPNAILLFAARRRRGRS
jgi:ubiquinone/menaquinone biosynthesis C-methylase UbiE